jgi:hypothetical protein
MRSTLEIVIAVKESAPATEHELRLALLATVAIEHFVRKDLERLIDAVVECKPSARMRALEARGLLERMFEARKKAPDEWLGPENTPGNPEYERMLAFGKKLLEKVFEGK